ncbi:unnamed protein product [Brachionus calyciflorus]|uniref:Uncharacterized protein n=1 Tax=Brachionus calyciflorus TaxID=104777 RepID=A0A813MGQ6_9BILA|nr:unnamed protein product [Brachionus calyciflorus]
MNFSNSSSSSREEILYHNMNVLIKELAKIKQDTSQSTIKALLALLIILCLINLSILMYSIYRIYKCEYNLVEFMQHYLKFHTRVLTPSKKTNLNNNRQTETIKTRSNSVYYDDDDDDDNDAVNSDEEEEVIASTKMKMGSNELSISNMDEYALDYECYLNNHFLRDSEIGIPRSSRVTRASAESTAITGYSKNNSIVKKAKIDKRYEAKSSIKREKSSDSLTLKMKRSQSWDAKNKVFKNTVQIESKQNLNGKEKYHRNF